jgi:hypothetical protein
VRDIIWRTGKFYRRDGSAFVPFGGMFAEIIYSDRCGISMKQRPIVECI